ncbi:MAG: DUF4349 domain-containing protein [Anaerolineae bacterium]|nr:DUF4349 domain-containing protein [Anaerolineae bacterium]
MKHYILWAIAIALSTIVGCAASTPEMIEVVKTVEVEKEVESVTVITNVQDEAVVLDEGESLPKMIIYTGNLELVVGDTLKTQDDIARMMNEMGGLVLTSDSYAYDSGLRRVNMTLKVPVDKFNTTMSALRAMAIEINHDGVSSQDVTQEYVDLESRLRALEVKATRLEELMEEAEDTEAVLAVYEQLSATQQEIEQVKGRLQYLERSAAMSTINVELVPDALSQPVEIAGWRPGGTAKRAIEALIEAFQFLVDALIWIVLLILPVVIFIGLVIFGFIRLLALIFGRRRRRQQVIEDDTSVK